MKVIGLTGGIGSGKSTVARFLAGLGAVVVDTDAIGHKAFQPGSDGWREVVAVFGKKVLAADGSVDRRKLGELVFQDKSLLAQLNRIMHPRIYEMVKTYLAECRSRGVGILVLEVPLLFEVGWFDLVDEVWVTFAPEDVVLKRLMKRNHMVKPEALARIKTQLPVEERLKRADVVIDTDCTLDELKDKVKGLWEKEGQDKAETSRP